ncbi:hypothetical protein WN51_10674 [Melipona quadrifasciata]|uniref:Uncharacterized protein n=1 Tax=Melipona quadrifasciata TaxID=166423 RepID=A0A0N0BL39_9HYME|nr:hypothetical protein WN51_10674 [Melipona quadrifasciata]
MRNRVWLKESNEAGGRVENIDGERNKGGKTGWQTSEERMGNTRKFLWDFQWYLLDECSSAILMTTFFASIARYSSEHGAQSPIKSIHIARPSSPWAFTNLNERTRSEEGDEVFSRIANIVLTPKRAGVSAEGAGRS